MYKASLWTVQLNSAYLILGSRHNQIILFLNEKFLQTHFHIVFKDCMKPHTATSSVDIETL